MEVLYFIQDSMFDVGDSFCAIGFHSSVYVWNQFHFWTPILLNRKNLNPWWILKGEKMKLV